MRIITSLGLVAALSCLICAPILQAQESTPIMDDPEGILKIMHAIRDHQQATKEKFANQSEFRRNEPAPFELPSQAKELYREYIDDPAEGNSKKISQSIPLTINDRCLNDVEGGDVKGDIARYFFNVVGEGLDILERLEPKLVEQIYTKVAGGPLSIDCKSDIGTFHFGIDLFFWSHHAINFPNAGRSLRNIRRLREYKGEWYLDYERESKMEQENKNNFFHEFLHHAAIDNLKVSEHNKCTGELMNKRQLDRVYSCAGLAFPTKYGFVAVEPGQVHSMTGQACRTCLQHPHDYCAKFPEGPSPDLKSPLIDD